MKIIKNHDGSTLYGNIFNDCCFQAAVGDGTEPEFEFRLRSQGDDRLKTISLLQAAIKRCPFIDIWARLPLIYALFLDKGREFRYKDRSVHVDRDGKVVLNGGEFTLFFGEAMVKARRHEEYNSVRV